MLYDRRRVPLADYPARRIALVKPSALGDIVHSLPVLTALRRRFPQAHISWVVNRSYEPLLRGHPDLDETLPFDRSANRRGWWSALTYFGRFLGRLRAQHFDLVVDLQGLLRSGIMSLASGAPRRVGLSGAREGAAWCYTDVVPGTGRLGLHAVERYWRAALALGAADGPRQFRFPPFTAEHAWADEFLRTLPRPWMMVGPGARWRTKRWPTRYFATLLGRALASFGGTALFVGSAGEDATLAAEAARGLGERSRILAGQTTLPQLTALLARADVMVANDTGPLHLAAALGRPVVAPYTCTRVCLTGPYGKGTAAVQTRVWCAGSLRKRCGRMECLAELTPERLWPVLEEVLLRWHRSSRSA
jgi:lipopolysaccharide heptosyltransferase I